METQNKNPESVGPVLGIVIIIAILVVGGIFAFTNRLNTANTPTADQIDNTPDTTTETLSTQGTSTNLNSIEVDAKATNLDGLDSELDSIQKELK